MPLNIPLVGGWKIKSDSYNIILESPEGRHFFYSTIPSALESLIQKWIRRSEATTIQNLITAIKTLQTRLNKAIAPLNLRVVASNEKQEELI